MFEKNTIISVSILIDASAMLVNKLISAKYIIFYVPI